MMLRIALACLACWLSMGGLYAQTSSTVQPTEAPAREAKSATPPASPKPAPHKIYHPWELCITPKDATDELLNKRRQAGGQLIIDTNLLQTGGIVDIGLNEDYASGQYYFAALVFDGKPPVTLDRTKVRVRPASEADVLVKKKMVEKARSIVTLEIQDVYSAPWSAANLYLFTCRGGSPLKVSAAPVRLSPNLFSILLSIVIVVIGYFIASVAFRTSKPERLVSYINPIPLTAGSDGRASLAKLQVLMFSLVVFGLIVFFLLRTGLLTEISSTILLLLGITGVGSTAAKGADASRTSLTSTNRAWLIRKHWLPSGGMSANNTPHWRDLFTTEGEFDVFRYQNFIFSLVVGGALIIGGVTQLASFEIPTTLLGILGLSQVVYVGGKLVTPTSMEDLNKQVDNLREAEKKFRISATAANGNRLPQSMAQLVASGGQASVDEYVSLATDTATLFKAQTGYEVPPDGLQPSL